MTVEEMSGYLHEQGWRQTIEQQTLLSADSPQQMFVWRNPLISGPAAMHFDAATALAHALVEQIRCEEQPSMLELRLQGWLQDRGWRYRRTFGDLEGSGHFSELHIWENQVATLEQVLEAIESISGFETVEKIIGQIDTALEERPEDSVEELELSVPAWCFGEHGEAGEQLVPLIPISRATAYHALAAFTGAIKMQLHRDGYDLNIGQRDFDRPVGNDGPDLGLL